MEETQRVIVHSDIIASNIARVQDQKLTHFRKWKSGKKWLYASSALVALAGMGFTTTNAQAAETDPSSVVANSTSSDEPIDNPVGSAAPVTNSNSLSAGSELAITAKSSAEVDENGSSTISSAAAGDPMTTQTGSLQTTEVSIPSVPSSTVTTPMSGIATGDETGIITAVTLDSYGNLYTSFTDSKDNKVAFNGQVTDDSFTGTYLTYDPINIVHIVYGFSNRNINK